MISKKLVYQLDRSTFDLLIINLFRQQGTCARICSRGRNHFIDSKIKFINNLKVSRHVQPDMVRHDLRTQPNEGKPRIKKGEWEDDSKEGAIRKSSVHCLP